MEESNKKFKTGDILLCDDLGYSSWGLLSWFIKFMTKSDFSHIGMIVVDPEFTNISLKGIYVWTSGISDTNDAEDNKKNLVFNLFLMIILLKHIKEKYMFVELNLKKKKNTIKYLTMKH